MGASAIRARPRTRAVRALAVALALIAALGTLSPALADNPAQERAARETEAERKLAQVRARIA